MRLRRTVRLSLRALFAHRLRTALAIASVSAGVAAVVLTGGIGKRAAAEVRRNVEGVGTNLLVVRPAQVKKVVTRKTVTGVVKTLRLDDCSAIEQLASIRAVAPAAEGALRVKAESAATLTTVRGTTPVFPDIRRFRVKSGRFFDDDDNRAARRVAILGARVADALFPDDDPVGAQVRIRGTAFDVIGVFAPKGVLADGDEDNQVVVPIRTALRRIFNSNSLTGILVSVENGHSMDAAQHEIDRAIGERHHTHDFEIQDAARMAAMQKKATDSFALLTTGLGALALFVGGSGILALMLMTVKERTTEIGLRIAVGARPRDILLQFLLEATWLSVSGWIIGVALAAIAFTAIATATTWKLGIPLVAVAATFGMAVVIGIGFGALPARKASLISPIDALLAE